MQVIFYLVGANYNRKEKLMVNKRANYAYHILQYSDMKEGFNEYKIALNEKIIRNLTLSVSEKNEIICAGFYSNDIDSGVIGSFYLSIDSKSKIILIESYKRFDSNLITQNLKKKEKKKIEKKIEKDKDVELEDYKLRSFIKKKNGGGVLLGEQFNVVFSVNSTFPIHEYRDIVVISINENGEIEWATKIAKHQFLAADGYFSSYQVSVVQDKLFFVFNDSPKNLTYDDTGKIYPVSNPKDMIAVLVEVNSKGEQKKTALFSFKETKVFLRPKVSRQISKNNSLLFGESKNNSKWVNISF